MSAKLDSVFEHISGLYNKLKALKKQPEYIQFEEVPSNKNRFAYAEKNTDYQYLSFEEIHEDQPRPKKFSEEEILEYSALVTRLNFKDGKYYSTPIEKKPETPKNDFKEDTYKPKSYAEYCEEAKEKIERIFTPDEIKRHNEHMSKKGTTFIDFMAEKGMIEHEASRKGSELNQVFNQLTSERNAIHDKHFKTGIPMAILYSQEIEEDLRRREHQAIENFWAKDTIRPKPNS